MNHVPGGNWEACWTERGVELDLPPSGLVAVAAAAVGFPAGAAGALALAVPLLIPAACFFAASAEFISSTMLLIIACESPPPARVVRTLIRPRSAFAVSVSPEASASLAASSKFLMRVSSGMRPDGAASLESRASIASTVAVSPLPSACARRSLSVSGSRDSTSACARSGS